MAGTTAASLTFEPVDRDDADGLASWLCSDTWPFHGRPSWEPAAALEYVKGEFLEDCLAFWMIEGAGAGEAGERVGLFRLTEVSDPTPMLDIRIRSAHRGRGLGKAGLRWITAYVFNELPQKIRIEGQTRRDNIAMRRAFLACGYAKEAHYRRCWPSPEGIYHDGIGYGILRDDWRQEIVSPVDWDD